MEMLEKLAKDHERRMKQKLADDAAGNEGMKQFLLGELGKLARDIKYKMAERDGIISKKIPHQMSEHEDLLRQSATTQDRQSGQINRALDCMDYLDVDINAVEAELPEPRHSVVEMMLPDEKMMASIQLDD